MIRFTDYSGDAMEVVAVAEGLRFKIAGRGVLLTPEVALDLAMQTTRLYGALGSAVAPTRMDGALVSVWRGPRP